MMLRRMLPFVLAASALSLAACSADPPTEPSPEAVFARGERRAPAQSPTEGGVGAGANALDIDVPMSSLRQQ